MNFKAIILIMPIVFILNKSELQANNLFYDSKIENSFIAEETLIITHASATVEQCKTWATNKNATQDFINNADIYFKECIKVNIDPVMAYAQYALESGYGHYKGTIDSTYFNPCGLKVPQGGDCKDPEAHESFNSWDEGIKAHIDHIALYVGVEGYPRKDTYDPRHFEYLFGTYTTVETIGNGWCPSNPNYGAHLLKLMKQIQNIN
ncbi:hypothetical protein AN639_00485 [Candidatus Epulonipiscium fishelsonii]|uniref:Uncharacterized protein n=1 Tax=Candidatus Epulonipiscium fishelsonii TaxID=77094 RepID=A0ACC8XBY3_9FIRM|nr:hypothetical protein AN396_07145 [Epulopiscium sp. SCG-B11WGA-EpuloA1]ONI41278.1 hypothetical protein AN639_00485 [Epulopiscium sp. SCG-B05WGA-EpuloA1]ONI47296.1 hypothetical protein AN644_00905 [Epulopiscium sp. SCG-C06WGA-EpuloA1]